MDRILEDVFVKIFIRRVPRRRVYAGGNLVLMRHVGFMNTGAPGL